MRDRTPHAVFKPATNLLCLLVLSPQPIMFVILSLRVLLLPGRREAVRFWISTET